MFLKKIKEGFKKLREQDSTLEIEKTLLEIAEALEVDTPTEEPQFTVSAEHLSSLLSWRKATIQNRIDALAELEGLREYYESHNRFYYRNMKSMLTQETADLIGRSGLDGGPPCFLI